MKTITQSKLKSMSPCADGFKWYCEHFGEKSIKVKKVINVLIATRTKKKT